jgi:hypothetical protein
VASRPLFGRHSWYKLRGVFQSPARRAREFLARESPPRGIVVPLQSLSILWSKSVKLGPSVTATVAVALIVVFIVYKTVQPPSGGDAPAHLGIDALVTKVRSELESLEITRQSSSTQPLFEMKDFDLEISFVVKQSATAKGGLETEVVTVGGETEHSKEASQKVTLHMGVIPSQQVIVPSVKHIDVPSDAVQLPSQ